jgi:Family of unknown function (DUF6519)
MGNFSRRTFDELKQYVNVRLQQGAPIVDADWNEQTDIRKFELQTFLKWFVGNGAPKDTPGFGIVARAESDAAPNDFVIQGGDGSAQKVGRFLVEGWDILNESDIRYTEQPLYANAELAAAWDVEPLAPLEPPATGERTDLVYVDVWEREVNAAEDVDHLVHAAIGIETCVRLKREWVVRVAEGTTELPDAPRGHVFHPLALLSRRSVGTVMQPRDITDLRVTGLSVISYYDVQQVIQDAFGSTYRLSHDRQPKLKLSLRDAINAALRGSLPGTPEQPLTARTQDRYPRAFIDQEGDIWVVWVALEPRSRHGEMGAIWYLRYRQSESRWEVPQWVPGATDVLSRFTPVALEDQEGDVWVVWHTETDDAEEVGHDIRYNRYRRRDNQWDHEAQPLITASDEERISDLAAWVDQSGEIWVFWRSDRRNGHDAIWYNRGRGGNWVGAQPVTPDEEADSSQPAVLEDHEGTIWAFFLSSREEEFSINIWYMRFPHGANDWEAEIHRVTAVEEDEDILAVVAVEDLQGDIWVFWQSNIGVNNIWYRRYVRRLDDWSDDPQLLLTDTGSERSLFAFVDSAGSIWVFAQRHDRIWYIRLHADGRRELATPLTSTFDTEPIAFEDRGGDIGVVWSRQERGDSGLRYRTLIPAI